MGLLSSLFGGSTKVKNKVSYPQWFEDLARAQVQGPANVASTGYQVYSGPVAPALNDYDLARNVNTNALAGNFGMAAPSSPMGGLPPPTRFAGGHMGYGSSQYMNEAFNNLPEWQRGGIAGLYGPDGSLAAAGRGEMQSPYNSTGSPPAMYPQNPPAYYDQPAPTGWSQEMWQAYQLGLSQGRGDRIA